MCKDITQQGVQEFLLTRNEVSAFTANKELRHLRATFNFGKKKKFCKNYPTKGIDFFPIEKRIKTIPAIEDIYRVISFAGPDVQDYLLVISDTMARVGEVNQLSWDDVDLKSKFLVLYTRKKRGGNLTPRKVPMTERVFDILSRRYVVRNPDYPWVFCNIYVEWQTGKKVTTSYSYRPTILRTLCKEAGGKKFTYHDLRRAGASIMDSENVPIGSIQKILGHENRSTTELYLYSIGNPLHDAIAVYEAATEKSHTDSHTDEKRG